MKIDKPSHFRAFCRESLTTIEGIKILLMVCLFAGGCATTAVLKDAALDSCGTSTIYLSGWYTNVPDKSAINADPMGGYQFAYWVDDAGNACHGDPGINGNVGPVVFLAYKPQAHTLAASQASITEDQLKAFQEIPFSFDHYSGSGLHFTQFDNTIFRSRPDGKTFQNNSNGVTSIPAVLDIGSKACMAPIAFQPAKGLFLPSQQTPATSQDPVNCKRRAVPSGTNLTEEDRKKFDIFNLPHGTEFVDVP